MYTMQNYSRYNLNLNDIRYLVDYTYYKNMDQKIYNKFVMIRNYEIENEIAIDKDIYFIPYDLYRNNFDKIVWPIINDKNLIYSTDKYLFNKYLMDDSDIDLDVYKIYTDNTLSEEAYIPCDEIKIYKPINRSNINNIIHISNIINDIRIHYFCQPYENQKNIISEEINYNNCCYNEYIKINIPNIEELFKKNKFWYKEDLNLTLDIFRENGSQNELSVTKIDIDNATNAIDLSLIIEPFYIHEYVNSTTNESQFVKIYTDILKNTEFNYINNPLSIYMKYYEGISDNIYLSYDNALFGNVILVPDNKFTLKSKIGFDDNGIISLINEFDYPENLNMSLEESYFYYNKIDNPEEYYNFDGWHNQDFYDILEDEYGEEFNYANFNAAGYYIEIADNPNFDNPIYTSQYETKKIQNFAFRLNGIFTSWNQYPEVLFIHAIFIDKYLSKYLYGNIVVITKEHFKYFINDSQIYVLNGLKNKQAENMNTDNFNFINNINCIVKKEESNNKIEINGTNKTKILYKPIFYKVNDLHKISIRNNVVQNIGINLSDYLSKIDTFILEIEEVKFTESARNDAYVIFNINSTVLQNSVGYYNILNQDNEYITSGEYILY